MRLLPRSLFGRLVLVMLGGLLAAQLVTLYINRSERDQLLFRSGGLHVAQRIADVATVLDSMTPGERQRIAAVFDGPPLVVRLDRPAIAPDPDDAAAGDFRLTMFDAMLRRGLPDGMPVVAVRATGELPLPPSPPRYGQRGRRSMEAMMGRPMPDDASPPGFAPGAAGFVAQVRLRDGSLATFESYVSPQATSVPTRIALTLAALLLLVGLLSLVAVRWVTVPLRTLATAANRLGRDLNSPPLPEGGPSEVRQAARAFNTMQERISALVAERSRSFVAMSHDLKTPITRMRLRTELLDDDTVRTRFEKDLDEMQAMVTQTLEYMRDESAQEAMQRIDVDAMLESLAQDCREAGGDVAIEGRAAASYTGRPLALRRCINNLVDNALRYGRRATVVVEDTSALLTLRVRDEGRGMPAEQLDRAFEPFFRGEASRSRDTGGTGLGLGIARNIARAHGGDIALSNRPTGGLEATLTLPRDRAADRAPSG